MIDINKFMETGYYFGDSSEIFSDSNEFNLICDNVTNLDLTDGNFWECQYFISTTEWYIAEELKEKTLPHSIPLSKVSERKRFVDENDLEVISKTFIQKSHTNLLTKEIEYFKKYCTLYTEKVYNTKYSAFHQSIQCYVDGDKLDPHTDSHNGSDCVLILYLSNDEWNEAGGTLRITENGDTCKPIRGKFSLLDLTKHDVRHEVTEVKGEFRRYSYLFRPIV